MVSMKNVAASVIAMVSEAIQSVRVHKSGLLRRFAPRNDDGRVGRAEM
jgi:hypothetical protein